MSGHIVGHMTKIIRNRRAFLSTAGALVVSSAAPLLAVSTNVRAGAEEFLKAWMTAWNKRDAHALASLHTADCVTVNRFGTLIPDRKGAEEALGFLLSSQGPFGDTVFPPMKMVVLREVAPGVAIIQASWSAPALAPNGKMVPGEFNAMLLTYTLVKQEGHWKATQIDPHNVEHMELPYSNPDQKK
jgi:uncharacterized protein (TIGR02246 family)